RARGGEEGEGIDRSRWAAWWGEVHLVALPRLEKPFDVLDPVGVFVARQRRLPAAAPGDRPGPGGRGRVERMEKGRSARPVADEPDGTVGFAAQVRVVPREDRVPDSEVVDRERWDTLDRSPEVVREVPGPEAVAFGSVERAEGIGAVRDDDLFGIRRDDRRVAVAHDGDRPRRERGDDSDHAGVERGH